MQIRIELLPLLRRIEPLQAVLLEGLHQDRLGHLQSIVEVQQVPGGAFGVLGVGLQFLRGHGGEGAIEVVDGLDEVFGEPLDGEVLGGLDVALRAFLEVAEVGY